MLLAVEPFDQVFPADWDEVNTTDPPSQMVVGPFGVITGTAGVLVTITLTGAEVAVQVPFEAVTV